MNDFDVIIILTTFGLGGVILLSLTLMNKVTFFYDTQDFVCSFSQVAIAGGFIALLIDGGPYSSFSELFLYQKIISSLLALVVIGGFLYAARYSFRASINANGKLLGSIIYFYKLVVGTALFFAIVGKIQDLVDAKNSTFGTRTAAYVFLGLFSWMLTALINGSNVENKREMESESG